MRLLITSALAVASCAVAQEAARPRAGEELLSFTLEESPAEIAARLGAPAHTGAFGPNYFSWFYQIGVADLHDYSHTLCFRDSDRKLVSITRDLEPEANVDHLFPAAATELHTWPAGQKAQFRVRLRRLSGDRVLLAMGSEAGHTCGQLVLIRRSALRIFFPWINEKLG